MMKLRYFLFLLLILVIFTIVACNNDNAADNGYEDPYIAEENGTANLNGQEEQNGGVQIIVDGFVFEETDSSMQLRGFNYVTRVGDRFYYFEDANFNANIAFIDKNEKVINEISGFADLGRPPLIFQFAEVTDSSPIISSGIVLTHNNDNTRGWLVHRWSNGSIPMWLSAGIEAVALSNIGEFEASDSPYIPEHFGDLLLSPGNWGTTVQAQSIDSAYHFVRYLMDIEAFDEIVSLLRADDETTNEALNAHFYGFSSGMQVNPFQYTLFVPLATAGAVYNIVMSTDWATYCFIFNSFEQYLDNDRIMMYVAYSDDGIEFVYNWHSLHFDFEFIPIRRANLLYSHARSGGGWAGQFNNEFTVYNISRVGNIYLVVHEAVHVIDIQISSASPYHSFSFIPFTEGLAMALSDRHAIADFDNFGMYRAHVERLPVDMWKDEQSELLYNMFGTENAFDYFYERFIEGFDIIGTSHFYAYRYLYHRETLEDPLSDLWQPLFNPDVSPYIASYVTANSFVNYLLDTYGDEMYAQVHLNVDNFENVYGITLHEMIDRWKGFLKDFGDEIRTAVTA